MRKKKSEILKSELNKIPEEKQKPELESTSKSAEAIKLKSAMDWLNANYDFRYNVSSNEVEYRIKNKGEYVTFDEYDSNGVKAKLLLYGGINISKLQYEQILVSEFISEKYDPLKKYLFSLPKWDGKDYIREFLNQVYLKSEKDRNYFIKGFTKWFVALVMSLVEDSPDPYHINQVALILVGKQGKHKTTWLGSIVPDPLRLKYYYPSSFNPHNKDHEKYLATKILINLDEMSSFNRTDIETFKSKLSQPQVVLRLPYARGDIHAKRRASFCGSINDKQFLRDETGSRRWFVVEIEDIKYMPGFDVSKMYAQALQLYREGFEYWFEGSDLLEIEQHNMQFSQPTMEEELLLLYFEPATKEQEPTFDNEIKYLTTTEIAHNIATNNQRMNVNGSVLKSLGKALNKHQFIRKGMRVGDAKKTLYCWKVIPHLAGQTKDSSAGEQSENNNQNEDMNII